MEDRIWIKNSLKLQEILGFAVFRKWLSDSSTTSCAGKCLCWENIRFSFEKRGGWNIYWEVEQCVLEPYMESGNPTQRVGILHREWEPYMESGNPTWRVGTLHREWEPYIESGNPTQRVLRVLWFDQNLASGQLLFPALYRWWSLREHEGSGVSVCVCVCVHVCLCLHTCVYVHICLCIIPRERSPPPPPPPPQSSLRIFVRDIPHIFSLIPSSKARWLCRPSVLCIAMDINSQVEICLTLFH